MEITECDEFVVTHQSSTKQLLTMTEQQLQHQQDDTTMFDDERLLSRGQKSSNKINVVD